MQYISPAHPGLQVTWHTYLGWGAGMPRSPPPPDGSTLALTLLVLLILNCTGKTFHSYTQTELTYTSGVSLQSLYFYKTLAEHTTLVVFYKSVAFSD